METLKNNSELMKTIVETFLVEETVELIYDNKQLDKWNNLVNELELKGQEKTRIADKSPIPFLPMNKSLLNIFQTLCPEKKDIKEYDTTPIPVEILDLISLSKREQYFQKIQIWCDETHPDPACIGITSDFIPIEKEYKWHHEKPCKSSGEALGFLQSIGKEPYNKEGGYWSNEKFYLIGKWSDVIHSFEQLKEMAIKRFCAEKQNLYEKQIKEAQRNLEDLKIESFDKFN